MRQGSRYGGFAGAEARSTPGETERLGERRREDGGELRGDFEYRPIGLGPEPGLAVDVVALRCLELREADPAAPKEEPLAGGEVG